jgi:hypothetical protein
MTAGHVFISHGSENLREAEEISAFIEGHGIKTWIAPRDVRPGMDYSEQLQSAIEQCLAFVVLVTETANSSPYVRAETEMAFSNNKPIFPVRQSDIMPAAGLAFFLKIRHWTDAYGANAEASMDRLARELRALAGVGPEAEAAVPSSPVPSSPAPVVAPPAAPPAPPPPAARSALPRSTLFAMAAAGLLVVAVVIFVMIQQGRPPAPAPPPDPIPGPAPTPTPTPTPGPTTAGIDRNLLVGRWADDGNCANALEFTADGRVLTADGTEGAVWVLNGDQLVVTTANGEQHTVRINSVDQSAIYSTNDDGSVESSTRC